LVQDNLYLDLVLHTWDESPEKVKKLLFIQDMNEELNKLHKISGLTPLSTIISNGSKDMVDYVL
jgi:hypothetical protein